MKSMLGSKLSEGVILGYFVVKNHLVCKGAVFYIGYTAIWGSYMWGFKHTPLPLL